MVKLSPNTRQPKTAICVATFKRPKGLAALLDSLKELNLEGLNVHLIVADNDPEGTAGQLIENRRVLLPFPVTYVVEPTRGISSVRNRLVKEADAIGASFIASVDDDATVTPSWLSLLVEESIRSNADIVGGPQIYVPGDETPEYIKLCFPSPRFSTGQTVSRVSTGNVLYRMDLLNQIPGPFEVELNLSGGADSLLAEKAKLLGATIVWCNEATVYEEIHHSRANPKWVLRRQFRTGASQSQITKLTRPGNRYLVKNVIHGFGVMSLGSLRFVRSIFLNRNQLLLWAGMITFGVGELAGVLTSKATLSQYRTIEGT